MLVQDTPEKLDYVPVEPAVRFDTGMALASSETLDYAILDINLDSIPSFPIADLLTAKGVPVIFATGYGAGGLDSRFADFPVMSKPFSMASLRRTIDAAGGGKKPS